MSILSVSTDEELQLNGQQQKQMLLFYQSIKTTLAEVIEMKTMNIEDEQLRKVILLKMEGIVNN